jgi:hypothetical protein
MSSVSFATTSAASQHRRAASCAGCATTTGRSCTTSPERDLAGGYLRQRLRGVLGDPSKLGSLGSPLPHGAAHAHYARAAGAPRGAHWQQDDFATGVAQGILHSLHDDLQQHRVGARVVLPSQRRVRPPPYTGKVLKEKADSWFHGVPPTRTRRDWTLS